MKIALRVTQLRFLEQITSSKNTRKKMSAITSYKNKMDWVKTAVTSNAGFLELHNSDLFRKAYWFHGAWSHSLVPGVSPLRSRWLQPIFCVHLSGQPCARCLDDKHNVSITGWLAATEVGTSIPMAVISNQYCTFISEILSLVLVYRRIPELV